MKKIMIAAAIVCAAVVSQAASVYWTCTYVSTGGAEGSETYAEGPAYFVVGDATARTALITALTEGGVDNFNTKMADYYSFDSTGANGKYSVGSAAAVANATLGVPDSTDGVKAFLIILDSELSDSSKFYATDVQSFTSAGGDSKAQIKWGDQYDASRAAGAWNAVAAVPEPTSGLLLLLGVAGLALRRRHA